jgi:hypothetical protein
MRRIFKRQAIWFVCLFALYALSSRSADAQPRRFRPQPQYLQIGTPDQDKGRKILESFRSRGVYAGDNYFEFELRILPRRGAEKSIQGKLWTGDNPQGPVSRIILSPGVAGAEERLLVQSGPSSAVWKWKPGMDTATPLNLAGLFEKLGESDVTPFDLQMPYLYWTEFAYEGVSRLRGRPADTFLMYPPKNVAELRPDLTGIRLYLDSQYNAPVQAEYLGADGKPAKTVSVVDLKHLGDQWVVKSIDFRDEATRNKTRFALTGATVGLEFAYSLFEPGMLKELIQSPAEDRIQRVAP